MPDNQLKSRLELFVELIKALAWPVLVSVFLIGFWQPLHDFARLLPSLIGRSNNISIGGLSLAVGPDLAGQASPKVKEVLSRIKPEELRQLLAFQLASYSYQESSMPMYPELTALGFAEQIPIDDLKSINAEYKSGVRITPLGTEARSFLIDVLTVQLVRELNRAKSK